MFDWCRGGMFGRSGPGADGWGESCLGVKQLWRKNQCNCCSSTLRQTKIWLSNLAEQNPFSIWQSKIHFQFHRAKSIFAARCCAVHQRLPSRTTQRGRRRKAVRAAVTVHALVAFSFFTFLRGGVPKGEGKSSVLGIPLFLFLFFFFAFLLGVPKGTLNLMKVEGKGKAS